MSATIRVAAATLLCALAACTNGGDPKESGNMTNGPQAAAGGASVDTAGSAVNTTVPTGSGTDTAAKPSSSTSGLKADTSRKAP